MILARIRDSIIHSLNLLLVPTWGKRILEILEISLTIFYYFQTWCKWNGSTKTWESSVKTTEVWNFVSQYIKKYIKVDRRYSKLIYDYTILNFLVCFITCCFCFNYKTGFIWRRESYIGVTKSRDKTKNAYKSNLKYVWIYSLKNSYDKNEFYSCIFVESMLFL